MFISYLAWFSVFIVTVQLAPNRSGKFVGSGLSIVILTGNRCVTLTQLPEAFSGGSREKLEPEPQLTSLTVPRKL